MSKNKIQLTPQIDVDDILLKMKEKYKNERVNDIDGVKIDFANEWVHLRKSNTEPIIRVYSESGTKEGSAKIAQQVIDDIHTIINE
jgi:phosphomannomutase